MVIERMLLKMPENPDVWPPRRGPAGFGRGQSVCLDTDVFISGTFFHERVSLYRVKCDLVLIF